MVRRTSSWAAPKASPPRWRRLVESDRSSVDGCPRRASGSGASRARYSARSKGLKLLASGLLPRSLWSSIWTAISRAVRRFPAAVMSLASKSPVESPPQKLEAAPADGNGRLGVIIAGAECRRQRPLAVASAQPREEVGHLQRRESRLPALVAGLAPGPLRRLLGGVAGQQAEAHRHAMPLG